MTLPSQSARNDSRRSNTFRKKGLGRLPLLITPLLLIALAAWIVVGMLGGDDDPAPENGGPAGGGGGEVVAGNGGDGAGGAANRHDDIVMPPLTRGSDDAAQEAGSSTRTDSASRFEDLSDDELMARINQYDPARAREERDDLLDSVARDQGSGIEDDTVATMRARQQIRRALEVAHHSPLEARELFTDALESGRLAGDDENKVTANIHLANDALIFSPTPVPNDPFAMQYTVQGGDTLQEIARENGLLVEWQFISRINGIDPRRLQVGQTLKLITGPFHAVVHKSKYRLDLFIGEGSQRRYVRSFDVGLGEFDSTPVGMFMVGKKAINPEWVNPRTRQRYEPEDPENPIGEHWLALNGIDDSTRDFLSYGIHGTIEPESIGQQTSMGCVRMMPDDVAMLYETLMTNVSTVEIRQ